MTRTPCPPDHKHAQTTTCYFAHRCGCDQCRLATNARAKRRYRQKGYGTYDGGRVDPVGCVRRLQGLQLLGWRYEDIANVAGMRRRAVQRVPEEQWITPATRDRIINATETLLRRGPGPSKQTTTRARKNGYIPIMAWDSIDHDVEPPAVYDIDAVDEVAVQEAIDGHKVELNREEREEVVRRLHARKWSDKMIAPVIGYNHESILRIRKRLGLKAWPYEELVKRNAA